MGARTDLLILVGDSMVWVLGAGNRLGMILGLVVRLTRML